jgi:hypothetical protein
MSIEYGEQKTKKVVLLQKSLGKNIFKKSNNGKTLQYYIQMELVSSDK